MSRLTPKTAGTRTDFSRLYALATCRISALFLTALLALGIFIQKTDAAGPPAPTPFKVANIHFETNASACDMGIQIGFDTDGITDGAAFDPNGTQIYGFASTGGVKTIGGQTEGFLEGIEPQIIELSSALGCEPSDEEPIIPISQLFNAFPAGKYTFKGTRNGVKFEDSATLSYHVPAGPQILAPVDGAFVMDAPLLIRWKPVHSAILANLGPVTIVGYHVIVEEAGGEALPEFNVDVPATETSVTVPAQYLKPNKAYKFEVLSTEKDHNQTISEGFFCTYGVPACSVE